MSEPVAAAANAIPQLEPWFAALLDAERPPKTFEAAIELGIARHSNWRTLLPSDVRLRVEWSKIDVEHPSPDWWPAIDSLASTASAARDASPFLRAIVFMLALIEQAMRSTPGMQKIVEAWVANRRRGAAANSATIPLLPRESGMYATTMTDASADEHKTMAAYDAALDRALDAAAPPLWALFAGSSAVYVLGLAGFESRLTARLMAGLKACGEGAEGDAARRAALGMPAYHQFETPAIESATMESIAAATTGSSNVQTREVKGKVEVEIHPSARVDVGTRVAFGIPPLRSATANARDTDE